MTGTEPSVLMVIPSEGGTPRHLTDLVYEGEPVVVTGGRELHWTPDGEHILFFGSRPSGRASDIRLYRVSALGGALEPTGLESFGAWPKVRPGGDQISFTRVRDPEPAAVWVRENFLPESGGARWPGRRRISRRGSEQVHVSSVSRHT